MAEAERAEALDLRDDSAGDRDLAVEREVRQGFGDMWVGSFRDRFLWRIRP